MPTVIYFHCFFWGDGGRFVIARHHEMDDFISSSDVAFYDNKEFLLTLLSLNLQPTRKLSGAKNSLNQAISVLIVRWIRKVSRNGHSLQKLN